MLGVFASSQCIVRLGDGRTDSLDDITSEVRWLKGLVADTPSEIWFETGGPGDDLRFVIESDLVVEAQVKKGLTRGDDLWEALELLARGIGQNSIQYGWDSTRSTDGRTVAGRITNGWTFAQSFSILGEWYLPHDRHSVPLPGVAAPESGGSKTY